MCVTPNLVYIPSGPDFIRMPVACRRCWSCQSHRVSDLTGRALCEAADSDWTRTVTLTYDDKRLDKKSQAQIIHKEDFQGFMKRLRRRKGFSTRYLVAGEIGKNGTKRTHFHVILFGYGNPPRWELNQRTWDLNAWPYGHMFVDGNAGERDIRYVTKYLTKSLRNAGKFDQATAQVQTEWVSYSKKPILGIEHVHALAERYAAEKVFPHSFKYRPPFAHEGREYEFFGKAAFVFFDTLLALWPEAADVEKTPKMERAYKRYTNLKHLEAWEALPRAVQDEAQKSNFREQSHFTRRSGVPSLLFHWISAEMENYDGQEKIDTIQALRKYKPDAYAEIQKSVPVPLSDPSAFRFIQGGGYTAEVAKTWFPGSPISKSEPIGATRRPGNGSQTKTARKPPRIHR